MIVVADTSIFLNLSCIGREGLLRSLYTEVFTPEAVHNEFVAAVQRYPRFSALIFPEWVDVRSPSLSLSTIAPWAQLDPGESAAIALASELRADLLLIDEASGRAVARRLGLRSAGLLAVLLDAKQRLLISAVAPLIEQLGQHANFWLSNDTKALVLQLAGETP